MFWAFFWHRFDMILTGVEFPKGLVGYWWFFLEVQVGPEVSTGEPVGSREVLWGTLKTVVCFSCVEADLSTGY